MKAFWLSVFLGLPLLDVAAAGGTTLLPSAASAPLSLLALVAEGLLLSRLPGVRAKPGGERFAWAFGGAVCGAIAAGVYFVVLFFAAVIVFCGSDGCGFN